ncbi:hypothetical protein DFH11DRAFT_1588555 [Phellopilus nigrolimitatus]|nr:hypothetical protein DFH11DRAFT_1588555 [Phellopilus nigrolimitatus]
MHMQSTSISMSTSARCACACLTRRRARARRAASSTAGLTDAFHLLAAYIVFLFSLSRSDRDVNRIITTGTRRFTPQAVASQHGRVRASRARTCFFLFWSDRRDDALPTDWTERCAWWAASMLRVSTSVLRCAAAAAAKSQESRPKSQEPRAVRAHTHTVQLGRVLWSLHPVLC